MLCSTNLHVFSCFYFSFLSVFAFFPSSSQACNVLYLLNLQSHRLHDFLLPCAIFLFCTLIFFLCHFPKPFGKFETNIKILPMYTRRFDKLRIATQWAGDQMSMPPVFMGSLHIFSFVFAPLPSTANRLSSLLCNDLKF